MRRRAFIKAAVGSAISRPLAIRAQEAGRTYRLGCLLPLPRDAPINVAFFDELRRRGFIEGQNLTIEYRAYGLHLDRISQYAAELVQARVDVITTAGKDEVIRAAQPEGLRSLEIDHQLARIGIVFVACCRFPRDDEKARECATPLDQATSRKPVSSSLIVPRRLVGT